MEFENKIVVITGATSGIGKATRQLLIDKGAIVYNLDLLNEDSNDKFYFNCDVSDYNSVKESVKNIFNKHKRIDLLFANAGLHKVGNIEETSIDDFEKVLSVNLKGVFYVLKEILPAMRANGKGNIVLMGSDQSIVGKGKSSVYGLTKGAIGQLTKSTAIDYADFNIRVNCICPGTIDTPLLAKAIEGFSSITNLSNDNILNSLELAQPFKRIAKPIEIANAVRFLLSDESSFIT
jgi:NAD(P)-dependent dehydrogenase (short-subunit alcohol dehydrogenase family)